MLVRDIMTSNVITAAKDTLMVEAGKMMEFHKIERIPVVDRGKLVGIVTKDILERAAPSQATSLTRWELSHLLGKITLKEIMKKDVITIDPDATIETAIATAQSNRVGSLPVVEGGHVIGIVTTNDFFYKVLNPLMGIGFTGCRVIVHGAGNTNGLHKVTEYLEKQGLKVKAICTLEPPHSEKDLVFHLDTEDTGGLFAALQEMGYSAEVRDYKAR